MKEIKLKAYAKINLSIDVLGKREDGYHEVLMIMQQVDLWDEVTVTIDHGFCPKAISITTNMEAIPVDQSNLAYKAARLMLSQYCENNGGSVGIHLQKRIPMAAGLAGGSADGAAVLHALNRLWGLELSLQELMELGVKLGADVPFCLMGQAALESQLGFAEGLVSTCALATGIGESLAPLPPIQAWVVLSKPPIQVSTAEIYSALRWDEIADRPDTESLIQGLKEGNFGKVSRSMSNVLQKLSEKKCPLIVDTKQIMESNKGQFTVMMSGSGPTVFAISQDRVTAEEIFHKIKKINSDTFLVKSL